MSQEKFLHVEGGAFLEALDLDNTFINTRKLQRKLEADVELHGIDSDALREARLATIGFDTVTYLRKELFALGIDDIDATLQEIKAELFEAVQAEGRERFFLPGALDVLDIIEAQDRAVMFLTTGGGEWQGDWKIPVLGLDHIPRHVTSGRYKSRLINSYRDPATGLYTFPDVDGLPDGYTGYTFERYRLPDDRTEAHEDMRGENMGFVVAHTPEAYRALDGLIFPRHVRRSLGLKAYKETLMHYS